MRTLDSSFRTEKNKQENEPIRLYTIYNYDGASNNLYFAESDEDVLFQTVHYLVDVDGNYIVDVDGNRICVDYEAGQTYTAFPITIDRVTENTKGEIDQVRVTLGNVSRQIQAYLENYSFHKLKVEIKTVFYDYLDDTSVSISDIFYIDKYSADQQNVVVHLSSKFDILDLNLPARKFFRNYCAWKTFKGSECGFAGSGSSCNRLLSTCRTYGNQLRFGGFPSIPARRIYIQ